MCSEISTLEKGYEGKLSKRIYSFILKEFETGKVSQSFPQFVASFQFFDEINQPAVHFLFNHILLLVDWLQGPGLSKNP